LIIIPFNIIPVLTKASIFKTTNSMVKMIESQLTIVGHKQEE